MLQMISGYNPDEESVALPSMQVLSTEGPKTEMAYPVYSRLAAAATLTIGLIVTGGLGSENQVWIKPSNSNSTWNRKKDMLEGRTGHGSSQVRLDGVEVVVVAGGWGATFQELSSVEMYNHKEDKWTSLPRMLHTRVDFTLQVNCMFNVKILHMLKCSEL